MFKWLKKEPKPQQTDNSPRKEDGIQPTDKETANLINSLLNGKGVDKK